MTNSEKHGEIISYDKDGKILEIAWYTNGDLDCQLDITDGEHSYYHDYKEEIPWQKYTIKDGKPLGEWVIYHGNGQMQEYRKYRKGEKISTWKSWHPDGNLWYDWSVKQQKIVVLDAEYKNDNRHGIRKGYFTNGAKWFESNYIDGIQVGDCTYWQIDGTPKIVCSYNENGKQEGKWTEYFMDGRKRAEGMMKNGEMDGKWTFWYNTGEKECQFKRKDNIFVNATVYHDNGKIKDKFKV
jgi:antitoxin component YwqK of YwqJK toxin-antitoxin module